MSNAANEIIELPEELTFYTVSPFCKLLPTLMPVGKNVVVDLGRIKHSDSAALLVLLALQREAKKLDKAITFIKMPKKMSVLIELYRLQHLINASSH